MERNSLEVKGPGLICEELQILCGREGLRLQGGSEELLASSGLVHHQASQWGGATQHSMGRPSVQKSLISLYVSKIPVRQESIAWGDKAFLFSATPTGGSFTLGSVDLGSVKGLPVQGAREQ